VKVLHFQGPQSEIFPMAEDRGLISLKPGGLTAKRLNSGIIFKFWRKETTLGRKWPRAAAMASALSRPVGSVFSRYRSPTRPELSVMAAGLAGAAAACLIRRCQRLGAAPRPGTGRRHCGAAPLDEMRRAQLRELRLAEVDLLCLLTRQRGVMDASDGGAGEEGENRGKAWRSPAWEKSVEATLRKKVTWRGCDLSGETARARERERW
jgi:hypothetical protein